MPPKRKKTTGSRGTGSNPGGNVNARRVRAKRDAARRLAATDTKGMIDLLLKAWNFLQTEDSYRNGAWERRFGHIREIAQEADKRRKQGDPAFGGDLASKLAHIQAMDELHRRYDAWTMGPTRFTTADPVKQRRPQRLAPYHRLLPDLCEDEEKLPSTYTSLVPRPKEVTDPAFVNFPKFKDETDWKAFFKRADVMPLIRSYIIFYQHADLWGQQDLPETQWHMQFPLLKNPDNPEGLNFAQFENVAFEGCVVREWNEFGHIQHDLAKSGLATGMLGFATQRGIRRAAIQKILNLITNNENRDTNTPWRRVTFPIAPKKFQYTHFHPWATPRQWPGNSFAKPIDRHKRFEPSPWIYWYNEWHQQAEYLSAWTRQTYNKRYWHDFKRIALPVNFRGPYTFKDKCIYDDYWLKMGEYLVTLQANLEKLAVTRTRWLLDRVVEDIKHGEDGDPIPNDVVPRPDVDLAIGRPDSFQLIDEVDMSWLKFLCQPPTTKALTGLSLSKPEDTLTIILDHRLQTLFNDPLHNPFWLTDVAAGDPKLSYRPREIHLEHLLPILNLGGRDHVQRDWSGGAITWYQKAAKLEPTGAAIPNSLYQFSLKELKLHCTKLAEMGRIAYKRPEDPTKLTAPWWSGKGTLYYYPDADFDIAGGSIAPVPPGIDPLTNYDLNPDMDSPENPMRYPEERIRWRYPDPTEFHLENERQMDFFASEMVRRNRSLPATPQLPKEVYEDEFLPEIVWKQGPLFDVRSIESLRQSPAWEDILDYRTVLQKDVGYSFKTINFLRNLAYRMGRTIRHYKALRDRTAKASALTRGHLVAALDGWKTHVDSTWSNVKDPFDPTAVPVKLGNPNRVIAKVDEDSKNKDSQDATTVFKDIRDGIVEDMVQNRVMLFPSRRTVYTDKNKLLAVYYRRADIWSWGSEPIRQRHAAYRRERYFDMRRWPVNRQPKESSRTNIIQRRDEDPSIQPVSALYKYNIKVGPARMIPEHSDVISKLLSLLDDPDKIIVAEQLVRYLSKEVVKIVRNTDEGSKLGWEVRVVPPGTKLSRSTRISTKNAVATRAVAKLKPLVRPKQQFIPGPAVFPMGDTLLQQVKMSQDLEKILDPKPHNPVDSLLGHITDWITPPPERIPLVPDIDLTKAPSTTRLGLKRKVNTAFITSDGRAHKRQIIHTARSRGIEGPTSGGVGWCDSDSDSSSDGRSSDSSTHADFDHVLPSRTRPSGPKLSRARKREDGTWKIKIEPDLEQAMKSDISQTGARPSGGRPAIHAGHGRARTAAPAPNPLARQAHVHRPIIHPAPAKPGGTSTSGPGSGPPPAAPPPPPPPPIVPPAPGPSLNALARAKYRSFRDKFVKQFPHGFDVLPTSGSRLLCAFFAIIGSIAAQYPSMPVPTIDELYELFLHPVDPGVQASKAVTQLLNKGDLSIDQAAATLYDWGLPRGLTLDVGVFMPMSTRRHMIIGLPKDDGSSQTVWITTNATQMGHDKMLDEEKAARARKGDDLTIAEIMDLYAKQATNHFSGMSPRAP
ncbi:hypothetical protein SUNI508_06413 [Seiridium unicorne]|uniref:Uncharacterized protein n=1 Tax=Seiridium unicorne TaxID=138068 RepID=A0ABR2V0Q7_9PEZI